MVPHCTVLWQVGHLETTGSTLAEDVKQKSKIIKSYFMENKAGQLSVHTFTRPVSWQCTHSQGRSVGSAHIHKAGQLAVHTFTRPVSWQCTHSQGRSVGSAHIHKVSWQCTHSQGRSVGSAHIHKAGQLAVHTFIHVREMKKVGGKKQARSYKQQSKATQHTQGSRFSKYK